MRVLVYKDAEGNMSAFVEPSPGRGKPPVLVKGVTRANVVGAILPVILGLRRPKTGA